MGCGGSTNNAPTAATEDEKSEDIHKQYQFRRTLGKGASCRVVEAIDKKDETRKLAIKIMSKDKPVSTTLYNHEVDILSRLTHPNIIRFEGQHEDDANYYVLTSLCSGGELFDRIVNPEYEITEKKAAALIKEMLSALHYCHSHNIVHRDLKPENFVFETVEDDARIVLIDFGCAKIVDDEKEYKDLVGTVYYLAPELAAQSSRIIRTGRVLKQSDMWSLGVIAYVMLTGRPPFKGKSNKEIFTRIVREAVKFPEDANLSPQLKDFVLKSLIKNPDKRMTIDEALEHEWIQGGAGNERLNRDVIGYLQQFNYQSLIKKAITRILAENMSKEPQEEIRRHFERLDLDNDAHLDEAELAFLLHDLGYAESQAHYEAGQMILAADTNSDGVIDFGEFSAIWHRKLLSEHDQYIHRVFEVFDHNHDGQVDKEELQRVLGESAPKIVQMIEEVDLNSDGQISFEEFKRAMKEDVDRGLDMGTLVIGAKPFGEGELADFDVTSDEVTDGWEGQDDAKEDQ